MSFVDRHRPRQDATASATQTLHVLRGLDLSVERGRDGGDRRARRASARARCCTCSAASTASTRARSGSATPTWRDDATPSVVAFRNRHVGFVFQFHHLLPEFDARRERRDAAAHRAACRWREARPRAEALLRRVGLGDRLDHRPGHAVGRRAAARGHRARAGHAARRCCSPTSRPATSTSRPPTRCTSCCARCTASAASPSIIATHNPRLAAVCDRVLRLEGGRLVAAGSGSAARPPERSPAHCRVGRVRA